MVVADAFAPGLAVVDEHHATPEGRAWLATLPGIVAALERRWQVETGPPYRDGVGSWTAPATTADAEPVVVKVSWPHREARGEAAGLRHWGGDGAIRLLDADDELFALLLERCEPGTSLARSDLAAEEQLEIGGRIATRLWSRPLAAELDLEELAVVTAEWAETVRERNERLGDLGFDPGLVRFAADLLETLPATATRTVVVHGDLNPGNVLAAEREPWLAIDPKPMLGDPAYDPWPLLTQVGTPFAAADPARVLTDRFRSFAEHVGEAADRLVGWSLARSVEGALWSANRGDTSTARAWFGQAEILARVGTR